MTHSSSALIIDFGGVLTTDLWASIRACARREGLPADALLELMRSDPYVHRRFVGLEQGEVSQEEFEADLAAAAGISPDGLLKRMCAELRPNDTMLAAVETLRASDVRVAVLSNSWGTGYFSPYEGYQLEERAADVVVLSDQVRLRKPDPAIYALVLRRLGADAPDTVFVDDIASYLAPAEAMGMRAIHHVETDKTLAALAQAFPESEDHV